MIIKSAVAVDDGKDYLKRIDNEENYEELSGLKQMTFFVKRVVFMKKIAYNRITYQVIQKREEV